jgi:hypothetical protein
MFCSVATTSVPFRANNIGARLRDVADRDRLIEGVTRKTLELDRVGLMRTSRADLEILDHILAMLTPCNCRPIALRRPPPDDRHPARFSRSF